MSAAVSLGRLLAMRAADVFVCGIFQIAREGIELRFPEAAVVLDPGRCVLHRLGAQAAAMDSAVFLPRDEAGGFQHAQVFRYGGERHFVGRGEVADRCCTLACEARENSAARGVGERSEGGIEHVSSIVNHMV